MSSLPTSANGSQARGTSCALGVTQLPIGNRRDQDQDHLLQAFRTFADAARSLELSYTNLRQDVIRLERELAASNGELVRRAAENEKMRAHLDRLLEALPCGVLLTSGNRRILRTNPEALHILGMYGEDDEITSLSELSTAVQELLEVARLTNGEADMRVAPTSDAIRWLAARHAVLQEGVEDIAIYTLRDISERKRLDEVEARYERDQHLASVAKILAHEIRNPLGSIELFAGLLVDSPLDSEQSRWVEHVQAGVRMLSATVNNVLHFHCLSALECGLVDLGQLLTWTRDFVTPLARQTGAVLSLQNGLSDVVLSVDRHRLQQVLLNLILNSFHAMPEGGWVELRGRTGSEGTEVVIEILDTGPGIPTEYLDLIFEPGFTGRSGSPGLGLTVCRKIVTQHGGEIRARNRTENGAIFTITLPFTRSVERVEL